MVIRRRLHLSLLVVLLFGAAAVPTAQASLKARDGSLRFGAPAARTLDPGVFADLSTGVARVRTYTCGGQAQTEGTAFLVGTGVLMTARHVIRGACYVRVLLGGTWRRSISIASWYTRGRGDESTADVATIRFNGQSEGHVFAIKTSSASISSHIAAIGHPLGQGISLTQGKVVKKGKLYGIPTLAVRLLGARGGSGSPLVDNNGNVVGILQQGLGGAETSGLILGIDLPSWWPNARSRLCKAYPAGGIPGCGSHPVAPIPEPSAKCDFAPDDSCTNLNLVGRDFSGDDLDGIDFSGSNLTGADLSNTDLSGAIFDGANLTAANLRGANLTAADLENAIVDASQLATASLCATVMPDGTTSGCG